MSLFELVKILIDFYCYCKSYLKITIKVEIRTNY